MLIEKKPLHVFADIIALREEFPGADQWRYFDVAARGLLPRSARRAIDADLDARMNDGGDKAEMFRTVERVRDRFARLIGADADDIAITKNISEGLNIVAVGYPWSAGDNVVVCAEREHPNNVYVWLYLARTRGIRVKLVESVEGRIPTDAVLAAIDDRTRIVAASTVTFMPGLRTDLDTIGEACRRRGVLLLADAAQSAGILKIDVRRTAVDAIACSTQKGLLSLYGMGLLYVRREWTERIAPTYLARFGVDLGDAHEADLGSPDFQFMPGARRYDLGNYNFTAARGLDASLMLLEAVGTEAIENYVVSLSRRLAEGLRGAGFAIAGDPAAADFASIVTVYDDGDTLASLSQFLKSNKVKFSERRGAIRLSCHLYNSTDDVDDVIDIASRFRRRVTNKN
ncbi:aminotransferase class V-fold PLP-dependent enzyme [Pseudochelatococcus sp. B33]